MMTPRRTVLAVMALALCAASNLTGQVRLGRQSVLTAHEVRSLQTRIAEHDGRALIAFKPSAAARGVHEDGTLALPSLEGR